MQEKARNTGYDIIRIIAMLMIIVIHGFVPYLGTTDGGSIGYIGAVMLSSLCLIGAPLFFMLSGALLLDTPERISLPELFKRRIPKQAIPFVIWSLIYVIARIATGSLPLSLQSFTSLLYEPAYYQFWFMYVLLGIYLILPFLRAVVTSLDRRGIEYLLLLWLIFSLCIPLISWLTDGTLHVSSHVDFLGAGLYVGYFILGYYLKKYHSDKSKKLALILIGLGTLLTLAAALLEWLLAEEFHGILYRDYSLPSVCLFASGMFLLLGNARLDISSKAKDALRRLSTLTLGVFYVHMLVFKVLELILGDGSQSIFAAIGISLTVYALSYAVSFAISFVPIAREALLAIRIRHKESDGE